MSSTQVVRIYLSVLLIVFTGGYSLAEAPSTLRLAHVVFRHGDRSPTQTFPTDKHQENSWPQGFGQLTQLGMRQEYELGQVMREIYNGFLNDTYIRRQIYVRSTDKDRTLMSAYAALAGLYPPKGDQIWNDDILWQPIPVHTVNYATDNLLRMGTPCDRYFPMMNAAFDNSSEVLDYMNQNKLLLMSIDCPRFQKMLNETANCSEALHYQQVNKMLGTDAVTAPYSAMLDQVYESKEVIRFETANKLLGPATFCARGTAMSLLVAKSEEVIRYETENKMLSVSVPDTVCARFSAMSDQVYQSEEVIRFETANKMLLVTDTVCAPFSDMLDRVYQSEEVIRFETANKMLLVTDTVCAPFSDMLDRVYQSEEVIRFETANKMLLVTDTVCAPFSDMLDRVYQSEEVIRFETANKLLSESATLCERYTLKQDRLYESNLVLDYQTYNKDFLEMIRKEAGLPEATLYTLMEKVPNPLFCERIHNLTTPAWVTPTVFDKLQDMKNFQIRLWFYTREMQRIRGGPFLKELVNHTKAKVAGQLDPEMKMYLYSAHDTTLAVLQIALDNWDGLLPAYSSTLMFELHQRPDESYFVRLRFKNDSNTDPASEPQVLSIKGCALDCNVDEFYRLVQPMVYEGDWFKECDNLDTSPSDYSAAPIIIAVCAILVIVLLLVVVFLCYRQKRGISYQSANFSVDPISA